MFQIISRQFNNVNRHSKLRKKNFMTVIEKADVDQINNALNPQAGQSKPIAVLASNNKRYLLKNS
ncbi:hypothetical protein [Lactiplantibacillus plantarum]|uniref:hypothetical protein n=1 Tax=Lactiplantibacillus plantarum TaxID=1590 RepID=UPI001BA834D1|nr:hypothetical protein [Lactiplantibacillus plantarum]